MNGFAISPGTEVEPTWWISNAASPSAPRICVGGLLEERRPLRVVLGEHDLPIGRRRFADRRG